MENLLPIMPLDAKKRGRKWQKEPDENIQLIFIAKVALAAIVGDKTLAELVKQCEIQPNQIKDWRRQLSMRATENA